MDRDADPRDPELERPPQYSWAKTTVAPLGRFNVALDELNVLLSPSMSTYSMTKSSFPSFTVPARAPVQPEALAGQVSSVFPMRARLPFRLLA